jgi:hypothetical protein
MSIPQGLSPVSSREVVVVYEALAPIIQTFPQSDSGNAVEGRTMPVIVRGGSEESLENNGADKTSGSKCSYMRIDLPVVSGSGVRCPARDSFVRAVLGRLGLAENGIVKIKGPKGYELAELLLKGGRNTAGESGTELPWNTMKDVYEKLPFLGLFGTFRIPGRLGVTFAMPLLEGMEGVPDFLKEKARPVSCYVSDLLHEEVPSYDGVYMKVQGVEGTPYQSIDGLIQFCREMDAELKTETAAALEKDKEEVQTGAKDKTKNIKAYIETELEPKLKMEVKRRLRERLNVEPDENDQKIYKKIAGMYREQNIYSVKNYIPAGSVLFSRLYLLPGLGGKLMEACFDAYVEFVVARRVLGAMPARGFGFVQASAYLPDGTPFEEVSRAGEFWAWLEKNKEETKNELLENFRGKLLNLAA